MSGRHSRIKEKRPRPFAGMSDRLRRMDCRIDCRMSRRMDCRSGLTLIELMVASLLAVLLVAMTAGLIFASSGLFTRSMDRNLHDQMAESVLNLLDEPLRYAAEIRVVSGTPPGSPVHAASKLETVIYIGNETGAGTARGRLWIRLGARTSASGPGGGAATDVYGNAFYGDCRIGLRFTVGDVALGRPKTVAMTVDIFRGDGRRVYSKSRSLSLVNGITDPRLLTGETEEEKLRSMSSPRPADAGDYPPPGAGLILAVTEGI